MFGLFQSAIRRASVTVLITLIVAILGLYSASTLPQELLPPVAFPVVSVMTPYPLATPAVVEENITKPLEEALSSLPDLERIDSLSNENISFIGLSFRLGTDLGKAEQRVSTVVNQTRSRLPEGALTPTISTFGFSDLPVLLTSLSAEMEPEALKAWVEAKVLPALAKVKGIGRVTLSGGGEQQIELRLNQEEMARYGLSASGIAAAIQTRGLVLPVGTVADENGTIPVRVGEPLQSLAELENLVLTPGLVGAPGAPLPPIIRLKDVATVQISAATAASLSRSNGKPAIGLQVAKAQGAHTVQVARGALQAINDTLTTSPTPVTVSTLFNQAEEISSSLGALRQDGMLGGLLAVLIIFLFLGNWRTALVAAVSIPVSVLAALTLLRLQGISLNIFSIGGLAIAVGRLVDDSIVVIEIIHRKFLEGRPIRDAVIEGTREVAGAITVATLTSVAVFLPLGFVGGIIAEFFRPLAFAVTYALLASLVISLTVIPALTGLFLRRAQPKQTSATAEDGRDLLGRGYRPVMRFALRNKGLVVLVTGALFIGSLILSTRLATNMFGSQAQPNFQVTLTMPPGTPLAKTDAEVRKVEALLDEMPHVTSYNATVGGGAALDFTAMPSTEQATLFVTTASPDMTESVVATLREWLARLESPARIQVASSGNAGPISTVVEIEVQADDPDRLAEASRQIVSRIEGVDLVANVRSTVSEGRPEIIVRAKDEAALGVGLPGPALGALLRDRLAGQSVGSVIIGAKSLPLRILPTAATPENLDQLKGLSISTPLGRTVKLGDIADLALGSTPLSVRRLDGERVAIVSADVIGDDTGAAAVAVNRVLLDLQLDGATWKNAGIQQQQAEMFADIGLAILSSIFLVYLFMVIGLRSLMTPLLLLASIPLAAIGSFATLYFTNTPLGLPALMGLLILIGIVVTNGIVLIDLIEQYRGAGRPLLEAVVEGGARRVRPVVMTALTTVVGLLPLAVSEGQGGGSFISRPLALASIGGLISSTALTLVVVPVLYYGWNRVVARATAPRDTQVEVEAGAQVKA